MRDLAFTRRSVVLGAAALPMLRSAAAQARPSRIVIASANGVRACTKAMELLKSGGDTLDARFEPAVLAGSRRKFAARDGWVRHSLSRLSYKRRALTGTK